MKGTQRNSVGNSWASIAKKKKNNRKKNCLKQGRWEDQYLRLFSDLHIYSMAFPYPHLHHECPQKYPSHTYTWPEAKENMIILRYPYENYKSQLKRSPRQIVMPLIVSEHSSFALAMLSLYLQGIGWLIQVYTGLLCSQLKMTVCIQLPKIERWCISFIAKEKEWGSF